MYSLISSDSQVYSQQLFSHRANYPMTYIALEKAVEHVRFTV